MRSVRRILGFFIFICFFVGGFTEVPYAASPEVVLRYAGDLPIGHHLTQGQELFASRVDDIGKGRVKVEVYPAGQLYTAKDYVKVITSGGLDMAQCDVPKWSGLLPSTAILGLPGLYDSWPDLWRVVDSEIGNILKREWEKVDVRILFWMQDSSTGFASKMPLKKMEDFKGKRIRVPDEISAHTVKALGGTPAFLSGGEVYIALQRGTVDGAMSGFTAFVARKYDEVTKYLTVTPWILYPMYVCAMNLKRWNELSPDAQKVLTAAGKETQEWGRKEVVRTEKEAIETLGKKMEVYYLPRTEEELWRKACRPVYDVFLQKTGDSGRKLLDIAQKVR